MSVIDNKFAVPLAEDAILFCMTQSRGGDKYGEAATLAYVAGILIDGTGMDTSMAIKCLERVVNILKQRSNN